MDLPRELGARIGVLGGTFDPVHNGHLAVADAALAGLALDRLLLIPAAMPPHKQSLPVTPFNHRLAMLRLAAAGRPGLLVSDLEAGRLGPSFSVDTLLALRGHFGEGVTLFFLVGIDAFAEIASWHRYSELPRLAELVVVDRPDAAPLRCGDAVRRQFPAYSRRGGESPWRGPVGGVIRTLTMTPVAVSSTLVREVAAGNASLASLVPSKVADYIRHHSLYRP